MASVLGRDTAWRARWLDSLADPALAIAGPRRDVLFFWGAPVLALIATLLWVGFAAELPARAGNQAIGALIAVAGIITYAHLIAVVPRAYLNRDVFTANRLRLTIVPVVLIAALLLSKPLLVCAAVLAILWDVHHSAMQTFGLGRIYDMKAGNDARALRRVDLALNWALYVGPLAAGAALMVHVHHFDSFDTIGWATLAAVPGAVDGWTPAIRIAAIAAWLGTMGFSAYEYRRLAAAGYRLPAHKAMLLGSTALVSVCAWMATPPVVALAAVNLFHAVQYFALIWLKEGGRMRARTPRVRGETIALGGFLLLCAGFGLAYREAVQAQWLVAPFIACSLLHFWFDAFVWSVRKRQV